MSSTGLTFMLSMWGLILVSIGITLNSIIKHQGENNH
ncbi:hypothetical protein CLTEP_10060 [Clostridium tepidiprofundi DSM 19306]|uniref:Uncharacterized protein n=1 Tax=Clostridium tepidiprofundi DSM 19306 TaxID=1121338 RepID=A0A151B5D0_9CLOT|nr:hypothetical protein CLTEP_10060 [Clostridium tepidiprofundi DSM 19306]